MPTNLSRPLHVLHVTSGLDPRQGGTTAAIAALVLAQRDAGLDVSVLSTFGSDFRPDVAEQLRAAGIKVDLVGPTRQPLARHPAIRPMLRRAIGQADVIHIHSLWEQVQHVAAVEARAARKPYVFTPHGMLDPWSLRQSSWKKKLYLAFRLRRDLSRAAALHFADEVERDLIAPLGLPTPAIVERHVLDLSDFDTPPAPGTFRSKFPQLGERRIVLFLSRLHPKKGLDLLIPAFARAALENTVLVLAGPAEASYQAELQSLIDAHSLADRVLFTGMLYGADRVAAFADASLFVLPSYQENFGMVVIESLAAGTPVVISDQVNIHRQITDNALGAVVPTQIEPLADALKQWMGDEPLRAAAAARARPFVTRMYDRAQIAADWVEHYQRMAGS